MTNRPQKLLLVLAVLLAGGGSAIAQDEEPAPPQLEDPREILSQYPPFRGSERIPVLEDNGYYPCSDCHDNESQISNPTVRELEEMHDDIKLVHGRGRYWCLTCHHDEDRDSLSSLKGQPISYDEPYLLCGQCHFERQRDFFFGGHGKRLGSWDGERVLAACTECHDAHDPRIPPQTPYPPPSVRSGLERPAPGHHAPPKPWESADPEEHPEGGH